MMGPQQLASEFHNKSWPMLSELGFALDNDPARIIGPYQCSAARYRCAIGLFLLAGFDPIDARGAAIRCGRKWRYAPGAPTLPAHENLSNNYAVLARRFGVEVLRAYELRPNGAVASIDTMIADLRDTLPIVLERVCLADLVAIEDEEFGCAWIQAKFASQPGCPTLESISEFDDRAA